MNQNAKISMILGIVGAVLSLFVSGVVAFALIFGLGVAAIVFSVLAKKELNKLKDGGKGKGKGQATAGLVLGIVNVVIVVLAVLGIYMIMNIDIASQAYCPVEMNMVNQCVDNGNETATCMYMDSIEMNCYTKSLDESQYK